MSVCPFVRRSSSVRTVLEHENGAVKGICSKNRVPRDKSVTNLELTGFGGSDSNPASGDVTENQCDAERSGSPSGDPCSAGPIYFNAVFKECFVINVRVKSTEGRAKESLICLNQNKQYPPDGQWEDRSSQQNVPDGF